MFRSFKVIEILLENKDLLALILESKIT